MNTLILPENCKTVESTAFCDLTDFTLTVTAQDTEFGYHAFSTCTNLTVNYAGTLEQWLAIIEDDFTGNSTYKGVMYWSTDYTINCSDNAYSE
jgi:hypothetical protein